MGETVPEVLSTAPGRRPKWEFQNTLKQSMAYSSLLSFLIKSTRIFLVEKPGNTFCFDSELNLHLQSLDNREFSSNPEVRALSPVLALLHLTFWFFFFFRYCN